MENYIIVKKDKDITSIPNVFFIRLYSMAIIAKYCSGDMYFGDLIEKGVDYINLKVAILNGYYKLTNDTDTDKLIYCVDLELLEELPEKFSIFKTNEFKGVELSMLHLTEIDMPSEFWMGL